MTAADLLAASRLWSDTAGVELAEGDSEPELALYLQRNPGLSFVALAGETLVGAVLAGHDGRRGLLYHLSVAPTHRGAGIARELVAQSQRALQAAKIKRVLILVARDNQGGLDFWKKLGWENLGFAQPMAIDIDAGP
jgi:ribosomal protein S18 acetylase RimI-like enzyme